MTQATDMNQGQNALARLSGAARALAEAKDLNEVKRIRDIALAAQTYARAAKLGLEAQNNAAEIKLRAERQAGQMLCQLDRGGGGDRRSDNFQIGNVANLKSEYRQVLEETCTSDRDSGRWEMIADLPTELFEQHIAEQRAAGRELTTAGMLRVAMALRREEVAAEKREMPWPAGQFRVLYADPPWKYNDAGVIGETDHYGHVGRHYPSMSIEELCAMGPVIDEMATDDAVLFMWVTSPLLEECFSVIRAWGFNYKTSFVWDKVGHNFGHYNSVRHEFLLVCTKGSCTPDNLTLFDSVVSVPKSDKHSEKPQEFRQMIDALYTYGRRIELFARQASDGWETWGNENDTVEFS